MEVFSTGEILRKEGRGDDAIPICMKKRAEENIQGGWDTITSEDKMLMNRVNKRRKIKGKKLFT